MTLRRALPTSFLPTPEPKMQVQQFYLGCLAHASYLIFDAKSGIAAVVDPQRDVDEYIARAAELGVQIKHVLLTHFHADFIAGHLELREKCGATVYVGAAGQAEYECVKLADGDVLEFGDTRIVALETPGHTPEGVSFVLYDLATSDQEPHAVFTGDTLFVGDVGRPDLLASVGVTAEQLGGMLYESLHDKLMKLPDATLVYPAHGAGSMCGKNLGSETFTTIGTQRQQNYALQPMSKDEFIAIVTADQPQAPAYFGFDARLNKLERPMLDAALAQGVTALGVDAFLAKRAEGAQVVDARDEVDFAAGTLKGAWNVPLSGSFATWAGALLDLQTPIVLITEPGKEQEAVTRLGRIGIDTCVGYLDGGIAALAGHDELVQRTARIEAAELRRRLDAGEELAVLDVRTPGEWEGGHLDAAVHIPLIELPGRLDDVPQARPLYVVCRSGARSGTAISLLARAGVTDLVNVAGGMNAVQGTACTAPK